MRQRGIATSPVRERKKCDLVSQHCNIDDRIDGALMVDRNNNIRHAKTEKAKSSSRTDKKKLHSHES